MSKQFLKISNFKKTGYLKIRNPFKTRKQNFSFKDNSKKTSMNRLRYKNEQKSELNKKCQNDFLCK